MSAKSPEGGANKAISWNADAATITAVASPDLFVYDKTVTTGFAGSVHTKNIVMDLASKIRNEELEIHLTARLVPLNLTANEETYEDGEVDIVSSLPITAKYQFCVVPEPILDGKHRVTYFMGVYTGDTGSSNISASSLGDSPIQLTGVKANKQYTLEATALQAQYTTIAFTADLVIATDVMGLVTFIAGV